MGRGGRARALEKGLSPDRPSSALNVKVKPCVHVCFDGGKPKTSCATWFCSGTQAVEARKLQTMIDDAWRNEKPSPNS